jgi:hypothetical protein
LLLATNILRDRLFVGVLFVGVAPLSAHRGESLSESRGLVRIGSLESRIEATTNCFSVDAGVHGK